VAETLVVYLLTRIAPDGAFGVFYLLSVLVVATGWGLGLTVTTAVASALAFVFFRNWPAVSSLLIQVQVWVVIAIFLVVALSAHALTGLARTRAADADQRRQEADLAAELAGLMLRTDDLRSALDVAAHRLTQALGLPFAELELDVVPADQRRCAIALRDNAVHLGTLLVPADLPTPMMQRLRERVVPTLETLLAAARDREAITHALVTSRMELEQLFDLSSDLLFIAGPLYFKRVNRAFERTLGYSSTELMSRPFLDFVRPADRSRARDVLDEVSRGLEPFQFESRFACSDGAERWLQYNVVPYQGLLYGAARDVTDQRREEDRLWEAQRIIEESRDQLGVLAVQQGALRRVATLVARGVTSSEVFPAVAEELARCLGVQYASLWRYQPDGTGILVAACDEPGLTKMPVGARFSLEGQSVPAMVSDTGRPARMDSYENASGSAAAQIRESGLRAAAGAPIVVRGRVWGAAIVGSLRPEPLPPDTEARVADFAELVSTAIANAEAHAELTASRARIVAAADDARRRLERDLHDGAQQRLVSLGLELRSAEASVPTELDALREQISHIVSGLTGVSKDLQEISRGIHPAILSKGGLGPAVKTLARRSAVPVELDLHVDRRLPASAEVAAYYIVAEALTNTAKHARASRVNARVEAEGATLRLSIRDDGIGGADSGRGSGLIGLIDRVEALGGQMEIASHTGDGTSLLVTIPLEYQ
jgi:PAS domain S-box-containing protein